ncbi:Na+/H+ antiporter subunit G [Legionella antarctica]|uniref:Na+/H+ antiporter subunit G n=1 Tax=Legionella antarctica TaxID=2708020 RepID=A0A6F8T5R1_9GAMM|nr:monovalent cation/H(+) antiporter subunit G [Legionella antarctica]BCA95791.1 Na+/H+ antiporter subunit G [Legionella antarctica]
MNILNAIFMLFGSLFILIAAIGIVRMPDLLMRMHAATKAGTLGTGLILIGVIFHFQKWNVTIEALLTILFIFLTAPIASHLLARAAYFRGIKLAQITITDELKGNYDRNMS